MDAPCSEFDGMSDGTVDLVWNYTYDDDGFEVGLASSMGEAIEYSYNDDHFVLHLGDNYDDTPELEYEETYTRDKDGRVLTYEERSGMDTTSYTYTYDAKGRLTDGTQTTADGTAMYSYTYTGSDLNPSSAVLTYPGGMSSYVYTSSDNGRQVHGDIDDDSDGMIDRTTDTTLDDQRRTIESIERTGGMVTARATISYAKRGLQSSYIYADHEGAPDDYVQTSTFDSDDMWTGVSVESPSGSYMDNVYTETAKDACAMSRRNPSSASTVTRHRLRMRDVGLPVLFGVAR